MGSDVAQIISLTRNAEKLRIELYIQPDLVWFEGHFPDCPILPGVIQTHWAISYGREHLGISGAFTGLSNVKFMKVIVPNVQVTLQLAFDAKKRLLNFRYEHDGKPCSQGMAAFAA